jgi:hypothetical protein
MDTSFKLSFLLESITLLSIREIFINKEVCTVLHYKYKLIQIKTTLFIKRNKFYFVTQDYTNPKNVLLKSKLYLNIILFQYFDPI